MIDWIFNCRALVKNCYGSNNHDIIVVVFFLLFVVLKWLHILRFLTTNSTIFLLAGHLGKIATVPAATTSTQIAAPRS